MADIDPKDLFFTQTDLDLQQAVKFTENALHGADDGELYLEYTLSEAFSFDDNRAPEAPSNSVHWKTTLDKSNSYTPPRARYLHRHLVGKFSKH